MKTVIHALTVVTLLTAGPLSNGYSQTPVAPAKPIDPKIQQLNGLMEQAQTQLRNSEWDQAIGTARAGIEKVSDSLKPHVIIGKAKIGKGLFDEAIVDLDLAIEKKPRGDDISDWRAEAFTARSIAFYELGKFMKSVDSAYLATVEKSSHADAHYQRARAYIARSEFDKAINSLNRAIQFENKSADVYSLRGYAYGAKGNYNQAIEDEKKALEINSRHALAYQRRGAAYIAKKDYAAAIKDIDQAIQIQPNLPDALCDRALLFAARKDNGRAMADLEAAIKSNPRFIRAHLLMGQSKLAQGETDAALKSFDKAIESGDDASAYCSRGMVYQTKKEHEKAISDFTRCIELDAKQWMAYQGRAKSYQKLGKTDDAKIDLEMARELTPKPPEKKSDKSKGKGDKKQDPPPPQFVVQSKPVDPDLLPRAKDVAAKIDRLVDTNLAKRKIRPNDLTTDEQFVRRVYLDITGTIPTYRQTTLFLNSTDPEKRSILIDELLNSEGYASHFYNYWADVLRYKDQLSGDVRGEPYRQWIKQSLAENKPWNKMVYEMLTSEGLIWENPATGYFHRDPGMPLDVMNNTVRIFLGTRIGCAQCHNHPFDRWTQKEFYQIAAFTFGTQNSTNGGDKRFWESNPTERLKADYTTIDQEEEERRQNTFRFDRMININMKIVNDQIDRKIKLPKDYAYDDAKPGQEISPQTLFGPPATIKPGEAPRKAFARWVVSKDNPRFAKTIANRLWKQLFGLGQIEPVDDMMDNTVAENPELMTLLENEMKSLKFNMKEYLRILLNTNTYQREACSSELSMGQPYHFPGPVLRRMSAEQVWDSFLTLAIPPTEYHELPSSMRTNLFDLDLKSTSAKELLLAERKANEVDGVQRKWDSKFTYSGVLLARASELPSPVPPNHFLRMFGQSDRELISASSTTGSVPQILLMFNGPVSHMLLEKNSTIYNNIVKKATVPEGVRTLFLTILSREPEPEELKLAISEVKENNAAGYGNVVWSLVNTREFLFIQ